MADREGLTVLGRDVNVGDGLSPGRVRGGEKRGAGLSPALGVAADGRERAPLEVEHRAPPKVG